MAIAIPIVSDSDNTIKFYNIDFDTQKNYQIKITDIYFCKIVVVDVDGVFFCNGYVLLEFTLDCVEEGSYKLEIIESLSQDIVNTFLAIVN